MSSNYHRVNSELYMLTIYTYIIYIYILMDYDFQYRKKVEGRQDNQEDAPCMLAFNIYLSNR